MSELDITKFEGHTPGPWHVDFFDEWFIWGDKNQLYPHVDVDPSECPIDMLLIAAAPDLLQEVKRLRDERDKLLNTCHAVLDAINSTDMNGTVIWIKQPYRAEGVHVTASDLLEDTIEENEGKD